MKNIIFAFLAINALQLTTLFTSAQDIHWNSTPQKGYVFQISNKEAQKLLSTNETDTIFNGLLYKLIDTYDVKKGWTNRPSKGHFILAKIVKNKLQCEYTGVFPYQVFLFKEYNAMALQVLDLHGKVREDAKVKFKLRRIPIDPESKTYRMENEWFYGEDRTVTVELDGFRSVFNIQKHEIPTWEQNNDYREGPSFYSYMITDKNKYKPNEKVRFKSYALSESKMPLRKDLEIWLSKYPKSIKLGNVAPQRPGSYTGEFNLNDTLKLLLDNNYTLQLREKSGRVVSDCSFKYEDYELFGNKLEIKLATDKQFYPDNNKLTITSTDVNGLMLKDAKANILIKTNTIRESFQPLLILPDTLFFSRMDLDPVNPTQIDIPAGLFQKTNTSYEVTVTVLNSENERIERTEQAVFLYSAYDLTTRFSNDSICFNILNNNVPMVDIPTELRYDGELKGREIKLPFKEKLNPAIKLFVLKNEFDSAQISLGNLSPELELAGGIMKDSFNILLFNPQKLDISWFIYQGTTLLKKGFGKELDYKSVIENRSQTFYVELIYSMGGQEHLKRSQYIFKEDYLNVSLDIPQRIYPGQQVDATIQVNDELGKPVKGVDLTALAVTSKLNYSLPDLPYYGETSSPRPKSAYYSKSDLNKRTAALNLNYRKWSKAARLDTMLYYNFTYPQSKIFKYTVDISDSTQFAPYVMQNGDAKVIYVIEVNKRPVYYSWTGQPKEYSFYVSPVGKQEISLRLSDRVIILDSISFEKGKKTILSIDFDNLPKGIKMHKLGNYFTQTEEDRQNQFVAEFENIYSDYAYMEAGKEFTPLMNGNFNSYNHKASVIAGPITPGMNTFVEGGVSKTTYHHTGGYSYDIEDNVVYKTDVKNLLPFRLIDYQIDPILTINDRVINKERFMKMTEKQVYPNFIWHARVLDDVDPHLRIKIMLPFETEASGIAVLLFQDCKTKNIISPCSYKFSGNRSEFNNPPEGCNNVIVLYNNGTYIKMDSIFLKQYINVVIDLSQSALHSADLFSRDLLFSGSWKTSNCYNTTVKSSFQTPTTKKTALFIQNSTGNITGVVTDLEHNEPLPGATIQIKGTDRGTVTDIDGNFAIDINESSVTLVVSYVGYLTEEIEVTRGSKVTVQLAANISSLDEVVVIGYGTQKKSELTGAISRATEMEKNIPEEEAIQDKNNENEIILESEQRLYRELLNLNTIRSNFSDVGFWEPSLYTDKRGKALFSVKFPDDITQWNALVYAMNSRIQTGTARKNIKSFKPLMAELHVPQFLTRGDYSLFIGKVLNYTSDSSIHGQIKWSGANSDFRKDIQFSDFHTDKLPVFASNIDSITASYSFTRNDGYLDGEERTVPIVEQGIIRADGTLSILQNGDKKHAKATDNKTMTIEILDNQVEIYGYDVQYLLHYKYDCNEQLASKLIGFINYKIWMQYEDKPFKYDRDINKIIERLLKNQNGEFLWSWWDQSNYTSYWMSAHILRALKCAKDAGYKVDLNIQNIAIKARFKFDFLKSYSLADIDLLHSIAGWKAELNYSGYIQKFDSIIMAKEWEDTLRTNKYCCNYSYLKEKLLLQEIRQMTGLPFQRDTLLKYKKDGILGEVYFTDNKVSHYWFDDNMSANVIAYRICRNDSLLKNMQVPMQMYFLSMRNKGQWNTYQSSDILMNVLPDLLTTGFSKGHSASVKLMGKVDSTIIKFPYHVELQPGEELIVNKESGLPIYFQQYTKERVTEAKTGVEGFVINTHFSNNSLLLKAGEPVDLITDVKVTKDAAVEHVMIEIPVPGACSYADKRQSYYGVETHREYFKDRTVIFCENMKPGDYTFVIHLLPRFSGKYLINPAQVSLMYIPVVNANTELKRVEVNDQE
jgi:alpha-2-macroglobulin